jgi:hypothetical protein
MKRLGSLLLVLCFYPTFLLADSGGLDEKQAQQFLNDSGLNDLIEALPSTMQQQIDLKRLTLSSRLGLERTEQAILKATKDIDGQQIALLYLTEKNKAKKLSGAMTFLSSPLGQRISVEERAASKPEAQAEMQAYAMQLAATPPSLTRSETIQTLAEALNADKLVLNMMKGVFFSVLDVSKLIAATGTKQLEVEMEEQWQSMLPTLRTQFSQFMLMSAHYSYRNIADDDLNDYITFLNSDNGQAYWRTGVDIIDLYLQGFVSELVEEISIAR